MSKLYMMVAITNRSMKYKFQEFYKENDHMVVFGTLGRGTANSAVLDYFGLEASEKMISFSVVTEEMWRKDRKSVV